ncbi:MAG: hypothetical protein HY652_10655 [Acidobacteria bacterium]|nr:hypothetical protein [Acidobacteriota bacterium]
MKTGVQLQWIRDDLIGHTRQNSRWSFASLADFLQGNASRVEIALRQLADPLRNYRHNFFAAFFQDDIRVGPRLTVNAGLRHEVATPLGEKFNKIPKQRSAQDATATRR